MGGGQYERAQVLEKLTSNVTAFFDLSSGLLCAPCLALWEEGTAAGGPAKAFNRAFFATASELLFPVVALEGVTPERPAWSDLLRRVDPNEPRVIVLTADPKKRVWPFARVSTGQTAWLYLYDSSRGLSQNFQLDLPRLAEVLEAVETVYSTTLVLSHKTIGFTKQQLASTLYGSELSRKLGAQAVAPLENQLSDLRQLPEFTPALFVAQKREHLAVQLNPQIKGVPHGKSRTERGKAAQPSLF